MPQTLHIEKSLTGSQAIRDMAIGVSNGRTVPLAHTAGLSDLADSTALVFTGGLAEISAGSIAMGWSGYLAPKSDPRMK